jgi:uncharacterized membrane protein
MTDTVTRKEDESRKKIFIALAGSMVALGSAGFAVPLWGVYVGMSFVVMLFGFMWYLQTQLASAVESIEIQVRQE